MSEDKADKSPYGNHSIEEVMKAELGNYYIQVGNEIFDYNGKMVFSIQRAQSFFNDIMENLNDMKENGSETDKKDANHCFLHFRIHPFRIH